MPELPFKKSELGSIGVEVELQIVDDKSYALTSWAKKILDNFTNTKYQPRINHEITQGMIEINTTAHHNPEALYKELLEIQDILLQFSQNKGFSYCGGGTHPFQDWHDQKIYPNKRYQRVLDKFQFLCKQATIFGQHVHFGCSTTEEAIYLTHALSQYIPQLIGLSSSSPFYQSVDSGFYSARNTQFNAFPMCGVMPYLQNWSEFSDYYYHLKGLQLIESMKDVYWDIRPKPEFGTVEVRILDTPLTLRKAAALAAFIQALSLYLLAERPIKVSSEMYYLYNSNRFQASRYGLEGHVANGDTYKNHLIKTDLLNTFNLITPYARQKGTGELLSALQRAIEHNECDASYIRNIYQNCQSLQEVVAEQCRRWIHQHEDRL